MKIKLTYFKESGKYYSEGFYESKKSLPFKVYEEVKAMESLPGLVKTWGGVILVSAEGDASFPPAIIFRKRITSDDYVCHTIFVGEPYIEESSKGEC